MSTSRQRKTLLRNPTSSSGCLPAKAFSGADPAIQGEPLIPPWLVDGTPVTCETSEDDEESGDDDFDDDWDEDFEEDLTDDDPDDEDDGSDDESDEEAVLKQITGDAPGRCGNRPTPPERRRK